MQNAGQMLTITDHNRSFSNLTYVYPVVSRRAGGVSVGINLNPNNACNWHCAYCQVPGLVRGAAPEIDLAILESELRGFLHELCYGRFMDEHVPAEAQVIRDIAFSGNGEPTSSKAFAEIVARVVAIRDEVGLSAIPVRLITNGSQLDRADVQAAFAILAKAGGEVWFKLDAGTEADFRRINGVEIDPASHARRLAASIVLCPTWVQTCAFRWDGGMPSQRHFASYLDVVRLALGRARDSCAEANLKGILLYGMARPSCQPEALHLTRLSAEELESIGKFLRDCLADEIKKTGLTVKVSP